VGLARGKIPGPGAANPYPQKTSVYNNGCDNTIELTSIRGSLTLDHAKVTAGKPSARHISVAVVPLLAAAFTYTGDLSMTGETEQISMNTLTLTF